MKHVDVKSFLIGVLFTLLVFVSIGADEGEPTDGNLGDIVVNSITIKDDGHGGFITAYNQDQKRTLYFQKDLLELQITYLFQQYYYYRSYLILVSFQGTK